jgi:molybdenum cofactor sulfurtransferase
MRRNFSLGQRCSTESDILHGKPTGMLRASLGAVSTKSDVDRFLDFVREFFVEARTPVLEETHPATASPNTTPYYVESLTIYPIKSCAGMRIPGGEKWPIHPEGLAWDREWCLVRPGTGLALSQKRYPRMALLKPCIDLEHGVMRVTCSTDDMEGRSISVPLSDNPSAFAESFRAVTKPATVCGDRVAARTYQSPAITEFFSQALGVACMLARFPPGGSEEGSSRHSKAHVQAFQRKRDRRMPGSFPGSEVTVFPSMPRPILLANESPILIISRSSLNRLNEQIKAAGGKAIHAEVFRANIIIAESDIIAPGTERPYCEDFWRFVQIGRQFLQILGSCRRCQMVCIDQDTGDKSEEPFLTLARTRRFDGKVFFGQHACHVAPAVATFPDDQNPTVAVGDQVHPYVSDDGLTTAA